MIYPEAARIANMPSGRRTDIKKQQPRLNLVEVPEVSLESAAKSMNVSRAAVVQAKTVLKEGGPGMVAAVVRGAISVSKAAHTVGRSHKGPTPFRDETISKQRISPNLPMPCSKACQRLPR
jgi:prolyl-tRNA editing enzyme YbaK/EbsC (Cys-tRNA(Pro) deacylase)